MLGLPYNMNWFLKYWTLSSNPACLLPNAQFPDFLYQYLNIPLIIMKNISGYTLIKDAFHLKTRNDFMTVRNFTMVGSKASF